MLDTDKAIVIMIDFQDKLIQATKAEKEAVIAEKMIKAANILQIPVLVSEQYPKGLGYTIESIKKNLSTDTNIIEKTSFSLLKENQALELIKKYNKKQIILFGIETHICVLQTAIELLENNFEVFLIKNACKSRDEKEFSAGTDFMQQKGVNILTLEIVLFELLKTSKHKNFKEIQALIK